VIAIVDNDLDIKITLEDRATYAITPAGYLADSFING